MPFHVYRDIAGWQSQNLPITTTSNEASRMFDSCISQFIAWREDEYGMFFTLLKLSILSTIDTFETQYLKYFID